MSPARSPAGGIHKNMLNSRFPASVNGCGFREVHRLPRQDVNVLRVLVGQCVVRQMHVKDERVDVLEPAAPVEVVHRRERGRLRRAGKRRGPQPVTVFHRNSQATHQRTRVFAETLLARDQRVAVMEVLHVAHLWVVGDADVVVRTENEARPLAL